MSLFLLLSLAIESAIPTMRFSSPTAIFLSLVFLGSVFGYSLTDTIIGSDFYDFFTWEAISDPTHGRV